MMTADQFLRTIFAEHSLHMTPCEVGSYFGYTTRLLSHLFKRAGT